MRRRAQSLPLKWLTLIVACCSSLFTSAASGQELSTNDMESMSLEELLNSPVVTASGLEEERSTAAANVTSITRKEIASNGWHSLAEILAHVPGLYVIDDLVTPSLGVRGVTGGLRSGTRLVRIMIDGIQVNYRPDLTAFLGPEYIPIEAVERVEIAKGPLSALYGANAFLATVNVITRKPLSTGSVVAARGGLVRSNPSYGGSGLVTYAEGTRWLLVSASLDHTDRSGLVLTKTFAEQKTPASLFGPESRDDVAEPMSVFAQAGAGTAAESGAWVIKGGLQRLDSMGEFQLNSVLTHESRIAIENVWAALQYSKEWKHGISTTAWAGFSNGEPRREQRLYLTGTYASSFQPRSSYRAIDSGAAINYAPSQKLQLKLGLDYENDLEHVLYYTETFNNAVPGRIASGDTRDLIDPAASRLDRVIDLGAYVQASSLPFERLPGLHLTANARVDKSKHGSVDFPTQFSWRAAAVYRWSPDVVTKLIAGRAFQTPSGVLMFANQGFGSERNLIGNRVAGSADNPLKPQQATSLELVASAVVKQHLSLEVGAYEQWVDDKIEFIQRGTDFTPVNQGQGKNLGVEASARLTAGRFSAFATASFQKDLTDDAAAPDVPPLYPNWFGTAGATLDWTEAYLRFLAEVRWAGQRGGSQSNVLLNNQKPYTLPAYQELNATLSTADLHLLGEGAPTRFTLGAQNILNDRHFEPGFGGIDIPNLGRRVFVEVRQEF